MATKQLPPPLLGGIGTASVVEEDEETDEPEEIPTLNPEDEPETETAPE